MNKLNENVAPYPSPEALAEGRESSPEELGVLSMLLSSYENGGEKEVSTLLGQVLTEDLLLGSDSNIDQEARFSDSDISLSEPESDTQFPQEKAGVLSDFSSRLGSKARTLVAGVLMVTGVSFSNGAHAASKSPASKLAIAQKLGPASPETRVVGHLAVLRDYLIRVTGATHRKLKINDRNIQGIIASLQKGLSANKKDEALSMNPVIQGAIRDMKEAFLRIGRYQSSFRAFIKKMNDRCQIKPSLSEVDKNTDHLNELVRVNAKISGISQYLKDKKKAPDIDFSSDDFLNIPNRLKLAKEKLATAKKAKNLAEVEKLESAIWGLKIRQNLKQTEDDLNKVDTNAKKRAFLTRKKKSLMKDYQRQVVRPPLLAKATSLINEAYSGIIKQYTEIHGHCDPKQMDVRFMHSAIGSLGQHIKESHIKNLLNQYLNSVVLATKSAKEINGKQDHGPGLLRLFAAKELLDKEAQAVLNEELVRVPATHKGYVVVVRDGKKQAALSDGKGGLKTADGNIDTIKSSDAVYAPASAVAAKSAPCTKGGRKEGSPLLYDGKRIITSSGARDFPAFTLDVVNGFHRRLSTEYTMGSDLNGAPRYLNTPSTESGLSIAAGIQVMKSLSSDEKLKGVVDARAILDIILHGEKLNVVTTDIVPTDVSLDFRLQLALGLAYMVNDDFRIQLKGLFGTEPFKGGVNYGAELGFGGGFADFYLQYLYMTREGGEVIHGLSSPLSNHTNGHHLGLGARINF